MVEAQEMVPMNLQPRIPDESQGLFEIMCHIARDPETSSGMRAR